MAKRQTTIQRIGILLGGVVGSLLILAIAEYPLPSSLGSLPAVAQRVRPENVWRTVYDRLPDFPKENQYISKETGKVEADNTLISRLIRYHLYVVGRSPLYRFDWKLTLADYLGLGVNGAFDESSYPSRATLKTNPVEGDQAAIKRLNRAQRAALVQALVDAFVPQPTRVSPSNSPASQPPTRLSPQPTVAPAPGMGGAQLLQPQR